jgi:hypothetical protein
MTTLVPFPSRGWRVLLACAVAGIGTACESSDVQVSAPKGRDAFASYSAIGTSISMGVQSGGVVYSSQQEAWPALLARMIGANFSEPLLRSPGCSPPLIAPLGLGRFLSGTSIEAPDSTCAGPVGTITPPLNNLALAGATAWAALNLTPKVVAGSPAQYDAGDRARYPIVLGPTQSQVSAMRIRGASFVSVELGFAEIVRAATSGLLVAATSYTQPGAFSYVPPAVFAPVFAAIADSVKLSGARAILLSVPRVSRLYALRPSSEIWNARTDLAAFGIAVAASCNGSPNMVFTAMLVPSLAERALVTGAAQALSCTDVPGTADGVLTPADVIALDAAVDQMNTQIRQLAAANSWAFADLDAVFSDFESGRSAYRPSEELSCVYPYGAFISLDGVHPNGAGHQAIANAVAEAVNAKFGFTIPIPAPLPIARVQLCP